MTKIEIFRQIWPNFRFFDKFHQNRYFWKLYQNRDFSEILTKTKIWGNFVPNRFYRGCLRCDWSTALGRCFLWNRTGSNVFFNTFFFSFYAYWHRTIVKITEMYWEVFVLLICKVLYQYAGYWWHWQCSKSEKRLDIFKLNFCIFHFWWEIAQLSGLNSKFWTNVSNFFYQNRVFANVDRHRNYSKSLTITNIWIQFCPKSTYWQNREFPTILTKIDIFLNFD